MSQHPLPPERSVDPMHAAADKAVSSPQRLRAVRGSGLLDSPREDSFDGLTSVAARLLSAPACFIAIVDEKRDFYKSQHGFPQPLADARQMEGRTFCHFTLDRDEPLVIPDTHADAVWRAVPTVDSIGVRAYLGVPLKSDGQNIGSFCVIDMVPRQWSPDDIETIRQLAVSAGRELSLRAALAVSQRAEGMVRAQALAKEKILAVVAHDLRTPLQILQLTTALLQRNPEKHDALTARMQSAVGMMKTMVEQLMRETPDSALLLQPVTAAALAADALEMMAPIAENFAATLQLDPMPAALLKIDHGHMLRVLGNLIGNSLKYSPGGGAIVLRGRRAGPVFSLTVSDSGVGMNAAELAQAFDSGWQSDEARLRGDGAGLGLGIVKALVERQGGSVVLASMPGAGTSVTVSLPCS